MLEVFNTLLRQLRLSVDYELTGSYDGSVNIGTKIIKAHEERQLQEAVIRTIGESVGGVSVWEALQDRLLGCNSLSVVLQFISHVLVFLPLGVHV